MITVISEFHNRCGDVYLIRGKVNYFVSFSKIIRPGHYRHKEAGPLSYEEAENQYHTLVAELNGTKYIKPVIKCKYGAGTKECCAKNCPAEFGGAAFWEIFGNSCLHKTR